MSCQIRGHQSHDSYERVYENSALTGIFKVGSAFLLLPFDILLRKILNCRVMSLVKRKQKNKLK